MYYLPLPVSLLIYDQILLPKVHDRINRCGNQTNKFTKSFEVSYIINIVGLLHISASFEAIFTLVLYEGCIYRSITKVFEPKHRCEILSFNNVRFELCIIIEKTSKNL
jgi:hypothetical protein